MDKAALLDHPSDILLLLNPENLNIIGWNENARARYTLDKNQKLTSFKGITSKKCTEVITSLDKHGYAKIETPELFVTLRKYSLPKEEIIQASFTCLKNGRPEIVQIRQAKERYELLFNQSSDAIVILRDGYCVECNFKCEEIFGYDCAEIINTKSEEFRKKLFPTEWNDIERLSVKMDQVRRGEKQHMQMLGKRKDGSTFHAELQLNPINEQDELLIQVIVRDISERVIYEEAIRESEERFKLLSNVAIESVVFIHKDIILDCNDQMAKLFGYLKRDDIIGKDVTEFIPNSDIEKIETTFGLKSVNRTEIRAAIKSGETKFLFASGSYIQYLGQQVKVLLFYDITSRKRAEQALEQSIDRFKSLVENSPNGVFILTDHKIKYTNNSGLDLLGFEFEDDIYNVDFRRFFTEDFRDVVERDLELVREGDEVDYREVKIITRTGRELDVGLKSTLTVHDNKPSIQLTINNLSTRMLLMQEQVRAQLAEEINAVLKQEIEEHKKTQKKLIAAEDFTRNIIESSIDMIIAIDDEHRVTEFNVAAQRQFGYTTKEILGQPIEKLYATKKDYQVVKKALEKNNSFSGEIVNVEKSGQPFTALLSASLIKNAEGKVLGSMGVSRDITELKKAEEELRKSEERYRDIFENTTDFIFSVNKTGNIIYANDAFTKSLGHSARQLKKLTIFDLVAEGNLNKRGSVFKQLVGDSLLIEFTSKSGEKILAEGNANIRLQDGKQHSVRAIFRDITKASESEQSALEQRAKLESIFDSTENLIMFTLDTEFKVTACNKNFIEYLEGKHKLKIRPGDQFLEAINKHLNIDLYQDQLSGFKKSFAGKPQQFELPLIDKYGEAVWMQMFLNPVYFNEELEEISCLSYDITDRKEIDKKIRESLKEKEVLLQEVHHRVKNNLQVISSILSLQSSFVEDEKILTLLEESRNRIKSMSYIHEALYQRKDFSSIEFTDYVRTIVGNLVHTYSITAGRVELVTEFDEIYLSIDQSIPCGLIINELVSNAMKYAYEGVENPRLNICINQLQDDKIKICVADNGVGLPEDFRYEEADSLGIQLVYTLAEQLDGEVEINREGGTEFLITFGKP
jgi:PAS domain S-box-containing protein